MESSSQRSWLVWCVAVLTPAYLLALALNVTPYLRGPQAWRWAYAIPGHPWRYLIPAAVIALYVVIVALWSRRHLSSSGLRFAPGPSTYLLLVFIALAVPVIQIALHFAGSPDILRPLFYRTVSPGASGVFTVGSTIADPLDFLRRYPELMPTFPVHPQRYPPGLALLFYGARRLLEAIPTMSEPLGLALRPYQCHNLELMRLSNATIATAWVQMALPALVGWIAFPLYGLARRTIGEQAALWAVVAYPLVPSFALWSARWDQFYPLLTCTVWYCFWRGLQETRSPSSSRAWFFLSGLILSFTSFLSFGPLAVLAPLGLSALLWTLPHPEQRQWLRLAVSALAFFAGLTIPWLIYQIALGNGFLEIWRVSMAYHLGLGRSGPVWLFYNLYDFLAFLGLPLALSLGGSIVVAWRSGLKNAHSALPLGFGLGLLLLDFSGVAQGEVARVWIFLTPFAVIAAAYGLVHLTSRLWHRVLVLVLLAWQLLIFGMFLRVVTTGMEDPPARAPTFELPASMHPVNAELGDKIVLLGYTLEPDYVQAGGTLHLTLYWRARARLPQPYTVFTHLLGPDGSMVAQQDNMPQQGRAPTTCWVPGEVIADEYTLTIPPDVPLGDYTLLTGLYIWETGERLPARGATATPQHTVVLATLPCTGRKE
ncbi:MAG: hypothetical protein N2508_07865 [Anaerolineae bacterium]|nr:hypothetical protein [Anaerolineae bacterium]